MSTGRWIRGSLAALALSVVPGLLHLAAPTGELIRAASSGPGDAEVRTPVLADVAAPAAAEPVAIEPPAPPPVAPPAVDAVPVVPPSEPLTGEVAPAAPVSRPFVQARSSQPGEVFALIVGIDDYPGSAYDLDAAVADANTVDSALARFGVPAGNRVVLRNGQARRAVVVEAIQALVQRVGPGSTVVFAYAGHVQKLGPGSEAMIASDGKYLSDVDLAGLLAPSQAERMWLLIAACFAGGFTEALAPGRILTAASGPDSLAYESPQLGGSFLVHHMVREGWLEGRAGTSVQEAFAHADARIAAINASWRPLQYDRSGGPMRFTGLGYSPPSPPPPTAGSPSGSPSSQPQPATTTTTTAPPPAKKKCLIALLCSRS